MLNKILKYLDPQEQTLKRYRRIVQYINLLEADLENLSDQKLQAKTQGFKDRLQNQETLEDILPEAYATVREAAKRVLGMRHFDVQLMAGIAFHEGKIAEQKTGEGKTLSATLPLYLNSLLGQGAHLVTVNDYLSQIGAGWMGPLYDFLGVSVGVIIHDQAYVYDPDYTGESRGDERLEHFRPVPRQQAYQADITYGTNNEFGFDYLRDNMAQQLDQQVQRQHYFAIVDEADSILIDEARTPLIISAPDSEPTEKYAQFAKLVRSFTKDTDYQVDEKMKTATLTDLGIKRLERQLKVDNLYEESFDTIHHIEQALKAQTVFERDRDYVVRNDEVIIVDEHTGRLMPGRRYSDGLHQAIEAKENVKIQQESRTLATISLQNYFRMYEKLAGMSGTAVTEAEELSKIYEVDVLAIPTNKPVVRKDYPDKIFKTVRGKFSAILAEIEEIHAQGQPILIGTRSIEQNEIIGQLLQRKKIKHQLLNAKNHEQEAFIIAEAGKPGAITVATNIAGRGVDIVLGGAKPDQRDYDSAAKFKKAKANWEKDHQEVIDLGGLHIIGSERHEARRIDNQLRGRAGRQGDPGSSRFFVSLEDEIMRIFGGEQISRVMDTLQLDDNTPIENPLITRAITQAQVKVEGFFFDQRKNLVDYDDVLNRQREIIYERRQNLLKQMAEVQSDDNRWQKRLAQTFKDHLEAQLLARDSDGLNPTEQQDLLNQVASIIPFDRDSLKTIAWQLKKQNNTEQMLDFFEKMFADIYALRLKTVGEINMREVERYVFLSSSDEQWMNHLDDMTQLRDSIWLRGGKDQALAEYKKEAFELFEQMVNRIELEALKKIFRVQVTTPTTPQNFDLIETGPAKTETDSSSLAQAMNKSAQPKTKKSTKKRGQRKKTGSYLKK